MLDDLRYRLRAIFHRREVERELAEELRFHVEQYADVEERAGVPRDAVQLVPVPGHAAVCPVPVVAVLRAVALGAQGDGLGVRHRLPVREPE